MVTKYFDFKGVISVDEEVGTPLIGKLREFVDIKFHKDDLIVGMKLNMGEYHHAHGNDLPMCFINIEVINRNDIDKKQQDCKIKVVERMIDAKDFFKLFKRLSLDLKR